MFLSLKDDQKCRGDDTVCLFKIIISELGGLKKILKVKFYLCMMEVIITQVP